MLSVSAVAALGLGFGGSANGAVPTSLEDCVRNGGHESGKYCSGGGQDGMLIREFIPALVEPYLPGDEPPGRAYCPPHRKHAEAGGRSVEGRPGRRCGWRLAHHRHR